MAKIPMDYLPPAGATRRQAFDGLFECALMHKRNVFARIEGVVVCFPYHRDEEQMRAHIEPMMAMMGPSRSSVAQVGRLTGQTAEHPPAP